MHFALHTTSPAAIARHVDAQADAQLEKLTGAESLSELSFATLLDELDVASEEGDWDAHADITCELKSRRDEGKDALAKLFALCCDAGGTMPMVVGGKLAQVEITKRVRETMATNWGTELGTELVVHAQARASVIARMAGEFVQDHCEDLLRAGWTS